MAAFTLMAVAAAASAAWSAVSQHKAGQAEERAGNAERDAAYDRASLINWNAQVADLQAADALLRGEEEQQRIRMNLRGVIGAQRESRAASNVDIGFGSAVDIQVDAARLAELDVLTTKNNAAREAWGFTIEAQDLRKQAEITRKEGANAARAGRTRAGAADRGAVGTILGAGASLLQQRYGGGGSSPKSLPKAGGYRAPSTLPGYRPGLG